MRDENGDLEGLLRGAFDAQARARVSDHAVPPAPRFAGIDDELVDVGSGAPRDDDRAVAPLAGRRHRIARWAAPLAAAASVAAVVVGVLTFGRSSDGRTAAAGQSASHSASSTTQPALVHVKLLNDDGATYGVGMPVIAYFSRPITDGRALQQATVATIDGKTVQGAWFFEQSASVNGRLEAHYRLQNYWPANSSVHVSIPVKGLAAGNGMVFDNNLTTDFRTGAKHVATVSGKSHTLQLLVNDRYYNSYSVSLGAGANATRPGTKVIMEKDLSVPTTQVPNQTALPYAQRLTYGGEYLCGAPWNATDIRKGIDSSGGSTNLQLDDAKQLFSLLRIGDVVTYVDTTGAPMRYDSGYGDWTVPWTTWLGGGTVPTR